MKKTKRLLSLLLALCMVLAMVPAALAVRTYYEEGTGDGSGYTTYDVSDVLGPLDAFGNKLIVTSDHHGEQGEPEAGGRLYNMLTEMDGGKSAAAILYGGDYEAGGDYETDRSVVQGINSVVDAYYENSNKIVVHSKGNHEMYLDYSSKTLLTDDVFASFVGWPRTGHVVTGYAENADPQTDDPIYYVYVIGWYGKGGTSSGSGGFNTDEIDKFVEWAEYIDASIPIFLMSHTPIHYLSSSRNADKAGDVIDALNAFPNVIFTWGHNHTEADPMYTTILEAGDVITWGPNNEDTKEILFGYAGMGAGRANGHLNEIGYTAELSVVADSTIVELTYYQVDTKTNEVSEITASNDDTMPNTKGYMDPDTTIQIYSQSEDVISVAQVYVSRPRYGEKPSDDAEEFSTRFTVGEVTWYDSTPEVYSELTFGENEVYSAEVTLSPENNYEFVNDLDDLAVYINGIKADVEFDDDDVNVIATVAFPKTADKGPFTPTTDDLVDGNTYAFVSGSFDALMNDLSASDVYVDTNIVSYVDVNAYWTAYAAVGGGFYLYSSGNFLSIGETGPNTVGLAVTAKPTTVWDIDADGYLYSDSTYVDISSTNLFGFSEFGTSNSGGAKAYELDTAIIEVDFIVVEIDSPVAGEEVADVYIGVPTDANYGMRDDITWLTNDGSGWAVYNDATFRYGSLYAVEIELTSDPDFATDPIIVVNGVIASSYDFDENTGILTLYFDRTRYLGEFDGGYYAAFIEVDDIDEVGKYIIVAESDGDGVALTGDTDSVFNADPFLYGNDSAESYDVESGYAPWYIDGELLYIAQENMVWDIDKNGVISQNGEYLYTAAGGPDADPGLFLKDDDFFDNSDDAVVTEWVYNSADGSLAAGADSRAKKLVLNDDATFTAAELRGPDAVAASVNIYKLVNLVPVAQLLDDKLDYLDAANFDYEDAYIKYDNELYQAAYYDSADNDSTAYFLLPYDESFERYSYTLGVSSRYVKNYDSKQIIGFDGGDDIVFAGSFEPASHQPAIINFYSINVYDGKKLEDYQIVLEGYMGERGVYTKKGYRAELYDMDTGREFRFDRPVYRKYDVEIKWVELEQEKDKTTVSAPSSTGSAMQQYLGAQTGSSNKTPAQILAGFTDIQGHWAQAQIEFVVMRGLFNGKTETLFAPDDPMTRGMLVTVLYRNSNSPNVFGSNGFYDVETGVYYNDPITWAAANGIVKGLSDSEFGPNNNITREQLATILYRYAAYLKLDTSARGDLSGFADAGSVSDWADEALRWCVANGIITGKPGAVIDPQGNATRAEVATMLQRFISFAGF